jgi:hypothetical protein
MLWVTHSRILAQVDDGGVLVVSHHSMVVVANFLVQ